MAQGNAKVSQIIGPVVDVEFNAGTALPKIYDSLEIKKADGTILVLEVQSFLMNMKRLMAILFLTIN